MSRRIRFLISSLLVGLLGTGLAWAGSGLVPVNIKVPRTSPKGDAAHRQDITKGFTRQAAGTPQKLSAAGTIANLPPLQAGQVYAGAAKANIEPRPADWGGEWRKTGCETLGGDAGQMPSNVDPTDFRIRWFEGSNCIYVGGFGIGPMNAVSSFDPQYGLWARSTAISDGQDTLILTILDGAYYFADYNNMCGQPDDCGWNDIANSMGTELGIPAKSFMMASSHSHTSPDFIGAWGGVPQWYMDQVEAAIKASIRAAVATMRPAVVEKGEVLARQFNSERRDFYHSAEENTMTWFRLLEPGAPVATPAIGYGPDGQPVITPIPTTSPTPTPGKATGCENGNATNNPLCPKPQVRAIATVASYAAHPTNSPHGVATADWVGPFEKGVEDRFGGVGLMFETGLGNISKSGDIGGGLYKLLPNIGGGTVIGNPDVTTDQRFWNQPVTNGPLGAGGASGVFDRTINQTPATVTAGKSSQKPCVSSSPLSARTSASVAKIGDMWITGGPGELFSNLTNTIKEKNPNGVVLPLSLVNDGLGYIMQSFETDHTGRQGVGFVGVVAEYEDAYSIDHCFGDMTLETILQMLGAGGGIAQSVP